MNCYSLLKSCFLIAELFLVKSISMLVRSPSRLRDCYYLQLQVQFEILNFSDCPIYLQPSGIRNYLISWYKAYPCTIASTLTALIKMLKNYNNFILYTYKYCKIKLYTSMYLGGLNKQNFVYKMQIIYVYKTLRLR